MKNAWRSLGEVVAVISVVISLLFVAYELRVSRSIALTESFGQMSANTIAMNSLIAENMAVWIKSCLGEEMTALEEATFLRLIAAWDNLTFSKYQRAAEGITLADPSRWARTTALNMYRYQGFKKYRDVHMKSLATDDALDGLEPRSGYAREVLENYTWFVEHGAPTEIPFNCGN